MSDCCLEVHDRIGAPKGNLIRSFKITDVSNVLIRGLLSTNLGGVSMTDMRALSRRPLSCSTDTFQYLRTERPSHP